MLNCLIRVSWQQLRINSSKAWEELLQLCSHHTLSSSNDLSTGDLVAQTRQRKEAKKGQLENGLRQLQTTLNDAIHQLSNLREEKRQALGTSDSKR